MNSTLRKIIELIKTDKVLVENLSISEVMEEISIWEKDKKEIVCRITCHGGNQSILINDEIKSFKIKESASNIRTFMKALCNADEQRNIEIGANGLEKRIDKLLENN